MSFLRASFAPYWQSIQHALFPQLEQVLGPLTAKQQQLVQTLEVIRVERQIPRHFRAPGRPPKDRGLRLQGDSSMNTGMECGENVKARATTRFHWCTLPVTRDAAEAALLPSRSRKPGTGTGHRLAFQTGQGTKGKVCWLRRAATVQAPSPDSRRPSLGAASRYSPDAAVSRRALSRVNAVVPARRLTRAAAEARMRRGRWSRGRATS